MRCGATSKLAAGIAIGLTLGCRPKSHRPEGALATVSYDSATASFSSTPASSGDAATSKLDPAIASQLNAEIAEFLGIIDAALMRGFRPASGHPLPSQTLADVAHWRWPILQRDAGTGADIAYSFHPSSDSWADVVRIEWKQSVPEVVEYHTAAIMSVWVRPDPQELARGDRTVDDYNRVARSLFNMDPEFQPRAPTPLEQDLAVSTAPERSIYSMRWWSDRVDAGFRNGRLYFVFYKCHPQRVGLGVTGPLFDDEFRRKNRR